MDTIGERLRAERARLGMSQDEFAAAGAVQRRSQGNYERGERFPDAQYLGAISKTGADVLYIVTGTRAVTPAQAEDDLKRMCDAWETLELALNKFQRTLSPERKRKAAEAIYRASKEQVSGSGVDIVSLVATLAA